MQVKEILINLMKIYSPSKREKNFAEFLAREIKKYGHEVEIEGNEICNVVVNDGKDIVVSSHIDTIDRGSEIKEEDKRIYGIGASDAKASIASILLFLKKAKNLNFSIALLSDEEEDAKGSEIYLKKHKAKMAIIMEPTSLKICHYHAGNIEILFEVYSEETHGSFCNENAIEKAIKMLQEVRKMKYWRKGKYFDACISFQEMKCSNSYYLNPGLCTGRMEARLLAEQDAYKIANEIEKIAKNYGNVYLKEIWNGFELKKSDALIIMAREAMKRCRLSFILDGMPSWTDALQFNKKGIKCIVFGPGDLKYSHTVNEHIDLEEVEKAAKFLLDFNEVLNGFHHNSRY